MYLHGRSPLLGHAAHGNIGRELLTAQLFERFVELLNNDVLLLAKKSELLDKKHTGLHSLAMDFLQHGASWLFT